jgi:hypothetical protein
MSRVLENVKSIYTQNDWRIHGLSDMDRELENEQRVKLRRQSKGMEKGAVWLNRERQKRKFAGYEDSERKGGDVYPYCVGLLHDFFDRNKGDMSQLNKFVLEKLFEEKDYVTSSTVIDKVAQIFADENVLTRFWGTSGRMAYDAAPIQPKIMSPDGKTDRTFVVWLLRWDLKTRWLSGDAAAEFDRIPFDGHFLHTIESELKRLADIPDHDDLVDTKRQRETLVGTSLAKMRGMLEEIQLA